MARIISFEGRDISVPDDATDDEVAEILSAPIKPQNIVQKPTATPVPTPNFFERNIPYTTQVAKSLYGVPEAATTAITGFGGQIAGGLAGIGTLITERDLDKAAETVRRTQQGLTYEPKTYTGKKIVESAALPFEYLRKGAGSAGGAVGGMINGEQGRIAGQSLGEFGTDLILGELPLVGGLRAAGKSGAITRAREEQQAAIDNAAKMDAALKAKNLGIKLNPIEVNPNLTNRALTGISREHDLNQSLSKTNERKLPLIAKQDLGLPLDEKLSAPLYKKGREDAGVVYGAIKKIPTIPERYIADFQAKLQGLNNYEGMTAHSAEYMSKNVPEIINDFNELSRKGFNGADIVNFSRKYRKEANLLYKKELSGGMSVEESALADAKMGIANSLEDIISNYMDDMAIQNPNSAYKGLSKKWKDAREYIAKSHAWQNATNDATGLVNADAIAKLVSKDNVLTGTIKSVGEIAANYPNSLGQTLSKQTLSTFDEKWSRYGVGGTLGGLTGFALGGGLPGIAGGATIGGLAERFTQPWIRKGLLSDYYQEKMIPDYFTRLPITPKPEPLPSSMLHPDTVIPKDGIELAPKGARISPVGSQNTPFKSRGLLDFADENVTTAKKEMWPYTEGADILLRQEALQLPEYSNAINYAIAEAERLKGLIETSKGAKKKKYEAELHYLEQDFAAGMKQFGIDNPSEAHGLQRKLYDYGKPTKMPIKKGGMLNGDQQ